jgi:hypothetical protein
MCVQEYVRTTSLHIFAEVDELEGDLTGIREISVNNVDELTVMESKQVSYGRFSKSSNRML